MRKCVALILVFVFGFSAMASGQMPTANTSPVVVELTATAASKEITFPFPTRHLSILNYDTSDGLWVNLRGGDVNDLLYISDRLFVGPSSTLTLNDFITGAITLYRDAVYSGGVETSPVSVLAIY